MGILKLRRNLGEKVIIQSPLGKLEVLVDSATPRAVILGFDGPSDYSIHREENVGRAIQNEGAKICYYPTKLLQETYWEKGEECYQIESPSIKYLEEHLGKVRNAPKCSYALLERDLKNFRVIGGENASLAISLISERVFKFQTELPCTGLYYFLNSLPFNLEEHHLKHFDFWYCSTIKPQSYYAPKRIDFHA